MENEIVITIEGILWVCGVIVTLGAVAGVISRFLAPIKKLRKDVDGKVDFLEYKELKERVDKLENYQDVDHKKLQKIDKGNEHICECLLAIMDHELDGNNVDRLQTAKHNMETYLIQK